MRAADLDDARHAPTAATGELVATLRCTCADLERLRGLLGQAGADGTSAIDRAGALIARRRQAASGDAAFLDALQQQLELTVTALQVDDLAAQLVGHAIAALREAVARLDGREAPEGRQGPDDVDAGASAHPVPQRSMDAGSVELF